VIALDGGTTRDVELSHLSWSSPECHDRRDPRGTLVAAMTDDLKRGDRVSWSSHGSRARGRVVRKLTSETDVNGHVAKATPDEPQYLVETDDGLQAAHHPSALRKLA
jgi:hypothetical protein